MYQGRGGNDDQDRMRDADYKKEEDDGEEMQSSNALPELPASG